MLAIIFLIVEAIFLALFWPPSAIPSTAPSAALEVISFISNLLRKPRGFNS